MSHRSWCAENPGHESYERLEFLGDAVLGWVTADVAFRRFPEMSEGQLTGIRKGVVNTMALAELAGELGIGPYIKLGKGEAAAGGREQAVDPRRRDGGADRGDLPRPRLGHRLRLRRRR